MVDPLPRLSLLQDFTESLAAKGVEIGTLAVDEKGTMCRSVTMQDEAPRELNDLTSGVAAEIVFLRPLSQGGMGEILLAHQTSLGREVAVKRLMRQSHMNDAQRRGTEQELLVEARVAGSLEHPNIVPVHIVGRDSDGRPLLVMKRVEGRSWADILAQGSDLDRDVRVLVEVCRALQLAHARGVVHCDVKPANVMIGSFGEVYLVDWGIAVAVSDQAPPELKRAGAVMGISGTPQYMAPEMALPTGLIDRRTDVFLAGAVLHHVITGAPPWRRGTIEESLFAAHNAETPTFSDDVDPELADICRRAMRRDPAERFASIEELGKALEQYRGHATARALCAEGEDRLRALRALSSQSTTDERAPAHAFAGARLAFSLALRTWAESPRARSGLAAAVEAMARREIGAGAYDSARELVTELAELLEPAAPPVDLTDALAALKQKRAHEAHSVDVLARVTRDNDPLSAQRERQRLLIASAAMALLIGVGATVAERAGWAVGPGTVAVAVSAWLPILAVAVLLMPRLRETRAARSALMTIFLGPAAISLHLGVCWWLSLPIGTSLVLVLVLLGAMQAHRAAVDLRTLPGAVVVWAAVPVAMFFPEHILAVAAGAVFISALAAAYTKPSSIAVLPSARPVV